MGRVTVTRRPGRSHYYTRIDGKYVSTGQVDQRAAIDAATRMRVVGIEAYRNGKRTLSTELPELIEEHLKFLAERDGRDREHIRKKQTQLTKPIQDGVFRKLRDVGKRSFEPWLNRLPCGPKTRNEYLTAWNVFLDWLVYEDRLDQNPLKGRIRRAKAPRHARRSRRALTLDETRRLSSVAGRHELLYLTAIGTGARRNELRQLLWSDVHETRPGAHIALRPETTKNGKGRILHLSPELAAEFKAARDLTKSERVFPQMPSHHTVDKHLALAGIAKHTEDGIACFHSLRHTFTTMIAKLTQDVRVASRMADHADITTTQLYLHTERGELAAVMAEFPELRATRRATVVVQAGHSPSIEERSSPSLTEAQMASVEALGPVVSEQVVRGLSMEPGGIEPPCRDSQRGASTRVVVGLISASRPATTPCASAQPD